MTEKEKIYQERCIALLNFKEFALRVEHSTTRPEIAEYLYHFLKRDFGATMLNFFKSEMTRDQYLPDADFCATSFSGYIIISCAAGHGNQLYPLLAHLWAEAAANGAFYRGAVTKGLLHHSSSVVYGPAMNQAHTLERKNATYPRLVVDPKMPETEEPHSIAFPTYQSDDPLDLHLPLISDMFDQTLQIDAFGYAARRIIWEHRYEYHCKNTGEKNIQKIPDFWRTYWPRETMGFLDGYLRTREHCKESLDDCQWLSASLIQYFSSLEAMCYVGEDVQKKLNAMPNIIKEKRLLLDH